MWVHVVISVVPVGISAGARGVPQMTVGTTVVISPRETEKTVGIPADDRDSRGRP